MNCVSLSIKFFFNVRNCLHHFVYRFRYHEKFHFWWEIAEILDLLERNN